MKKSKKESKLQHELVVWFSQTYPEYSGLLFEVYNNVMNQSHFSHRFAMGMIPGVSDLVLFVPFTGEHAGIEIKVEDHYYDVQSVKRQVNWGENVIINGGYFLISHEIEILKAFIIALLSRDTEYAILLQNNALKDIKELLNTNNKTFKI